MTAHKLHLGPGFALPADAVTQTLVVYGGKGMGKTNFGSVLVEELQRAGLRFAFLDPVGVAWGLQYSADGKGPGLEVLVLGGVHGDMPIEPTGGAVVADLVADEDADVLIDISRRANGTMWSVGERIKFVTDYCLRLFERQGERRRPLLQVIDEAGRYCPQQIPHGAAEITKCVGAIEQLVELGRNVGVGVCLITQRSARMNKSVSELAECMIAFRTVGPRSVDAIVDWFGEHVAKERWKELVEQLRSLPRGRALVVSPGWLEFEGVAEVRARETFDSSATPSAQKTQRVTGTAKKPPDLGKYQERMAATIERAKAEDPKELRRQLAEKDRLIRSLEKAGPVKQSGVSAPPPQVKTVEVPILTREHVAPVATIADQLERLTPKLDVVQGLREIATALAQATGNLRAVVAAANGRPPVLKAGLGREIPPGIRGAVQVSRPQMRRENQKPPAEGVSGLGQRILDGLAWLETIGIDRPSRVQVGFVADASATGGYFENTLGSLRTADHVTYPEKGTVQLTESGRALARPADDPLSAEALQDALCRRLGGLRAAMLRALIRHYPHPLTREDLGALLGKSATGGYFENMLGSLRSLQLVEYPAAGQVVALPVLFLEGR